jgi:hypothetical protein
VSAAAEALEALGHPGGALLEPRLLANLFVRFQAQVPLRAAAPGRTPEEGLDAWLEEGAGLCGEVRVAAFEALAAAAGFLVENAVARDLVGGRRRVLLALGRRVLLDPAFPLPAPLGLDPPAQAEPTGYGALTVKAAEDDAFDVVLETRGDERVLCRVRAAFGDAGEALAERAKSQGIAGAATTDAGPFRLLDDRLLRWESGILEISDAWSRFRFPFPASDADGLEALFGPLLPGLAAARDEVPEPTLAVYHSSATGPSELRGRLADPATHAALLPEGWAAERLTPREDGFERTLVEEGKLLRSERVRLLQEGIVVEAEGPLALFRTRTWRLEPRSSGTRLRVLATLRDPVPPRGLPEGTRRRLVFELASELLALDRLSSEP